MGVSMRTLIICSCVFNIIALILTITSLATDNWIDGGSRPFGQSQPDGINYGLYGGTFARRPGGVINTEHNLYMECSRSVAACVVSCKTTENARHAELMLMSQGARPWPLTCDENISLDISQPLLGSPPVISIHLYNTVVVFVYFQLVLAACAAALAIVNVIGTPTIFIFGLTGIEITSSTSALFGFIAGLIWGVNYLTSGLYRHFAFAYVAANTQLALIISSLGFSYWLVFLAGFLSILSCAVIRIGRRTVR